MLFCLQKVYLVKKHCKLYTQFEGQEWLSTRWACPSLIMEANRSTYQTDEPSALESEVKCILSVCCSTSTYGRPQSYVCIDEADERDGQIDIVEEWWNGAGHGADGNQEVIVRFVPKIRKKWSISLRETLGQQCTGSLSDGSVTLQY